MAFVFDSTVGGAASNSYLSVSEADDFFAANLDSSFWAISTAKKQAVLAQATNRIDREAFGGQLTNRNVQRLQFPRTGLAARDTNQASAESNDVFNSFYYISPTIIPNELKQATCEMALYLLKRANGEFSVDDNDLETLTNYKVGPLDLAIKDGITADRLPTAVKQLLKAISPTGWIAGQTLKFTA